jgi:hypothetical protein
MAEGVEGGESCSAVPKESAVVSKKSELRIGALQKSNDYRVYSEK